MKLRIGMLVMGIMLCGTLYSCVLGDDEIYLLPKGYTGRVLVFFSRPEGQPVKYENRKRLYEISANGILKTQFDLNTRWHRPHEFFYGAEGSRMAIPYVDYREARDDRVQACCLGTGTAGVENHPDVKVAEFYVGTKAEIDAALKASEKNPPGVIFLRDRQ